MAGRLCPQAGISAQPVGWLRLCSAPPGRPDRSLMLVPRFQALGRPPPAARSLWVDNRMSGD